MGIVVTFILNAVLNVVLGLAVAAVLGPAEYGIYAVAAVAAVTLGGGLFEWLRLSATRYYGAASCDNEPVVRATLNIAYYTLSMVLICAAVALLAFGISPGLAPHLAAAVCLVAVSGALFEYYAALARARFLNRTYAALVVIKGVLALVLMVAAGWWLHDAVWVMAALACAASLALLPASWFLHDRAATIAKFNVARLRMFAGYGLPVVAANLIYQIILLANRSFAADAFGYAQSGKLSLATDLSLRLFLSVGAALDVLLFQLAVQAEAKDGRAAGQAQLARNFVVVLALLLPLAAGFVAVLPAFEALIIPTAFRGDFVVFATWLVPGILLFCLAQFAISPVFQLQARTAPLIFAALAALACDGVGLWLLSPTLGPTGTAMVHSGSLAVGFIVTGVLAWPDRACRPPLEDILGIGAATTLMLAAVWPMRLITSPFIALATSGVVGVFVYSLACLCFNIGGSRDWMRAKLAGQSRTFRKLTQAKAPFR